MDEFVELGWLLILILLSWFFGFFIDLVVVVYEMWGLVFYVLVIGNGVVIKDFMELFWIVIELGICVVDICDIVFIIFKRDRYIIF